MGTSGYRDEREAMRARIDALEDDLAQKPDAEKVRAQLDAMRAELTAAEARIDGDRATIATLTQRIEALQSEMDGPAPRPEPKAQPDLALRRRAGIAAVVIGMMVVGGIFAMNASRPDPIETNVYASASDRALEIPGGIHAADPVAVLDMLRTRTPPGAELAKVDLEYVSSNGTIDLEHASYSGAMTFTFAVPAAPGAPPPPAVLGAPTPPPAPRFEAAIYRVTARGIDMDPLGGGLGALLLPSDPPTGFPTCTPRRVWDAARAREVPADAVAHLVFARVEGKPTWRLRVEDTEFDVLVDDATCRQ